MPRAGIHVEWLPKDRDKRQEAYSRIRQSSLKFRIVIASDGKAQPINFMGYPMKAKQKDWAEVIAETIALRERMEAKVAAIRARKAKAKAESLNG